MLLNAYSASGLVLRLLSVMRPATPTVRFAAMDVRAELFS
jgi:hypothetical protein